MTVNSIFAGRRDAGVSVTGTLLPLITAGKQPSGTGDGGKLRLTDVLLLHVYG